MKIIFGELDVKFATDIIIGVVMFIGGVFFDPIAGQFQIKHNTEGLPIVQILWCSGWAGYIIWTWWYQKYWGT